MINRNEFELADIKVRRGERGFTRLPVTGLLSGVTLSIPVHVIHGFHPGPVVGITGAIHGVEHLPIRMIKEALGCIKPDELHGTIVGLPVCNPISLARGTRITPDEDDIDFANLNRVFPGRRTKAVFGIGRPPPCDRSLTELLASVLAEEILPLLTHLIDFHCHMQGAGLIKTIQKKSDDGVIDQISQGMCRALGLGLIHEHRADTRTLTGYAASMGIHTCVPEVGGGGLSTAAESKAIALGVRGIFNVLKFLDSIDGEMEIPQRQLLFEIAPHIRPETAGYLISHFDPDDLFIHGEAGIPVERGQELGELFDPYSFECLGTLSAPVDGILYITRRSGPVEAGSHAYAVADLEGSRWIN